MKTVSVPIKNCTPLFLKQLYNRRGAFQRLSLDSTWDKRLNHPAQGTALIVICAGRENKCHHLFMLRKCPTSREQNLARISNLFIPSMEVDATDYYYLFLVQKLQIEHLKLYTGAVWVGRNSKKFFICIVNRLIRYKVV